jgi:GT2 family glycosyltransferase
VIERPIVDDVTVIVPTVGRPLVRDCLESIIEGDSWPAELLVIDQSRTAEIGVYVEALRRRGLIARYLPMRGRGVAAAVNHGVDEVRTPSVAITNDDCRVARRWLRRLRDRQRELGAPAVVTGRVLPEEGHEVPSVIMSTIPAIYRRALNDRDVLFAANMLTPLEVWQAVGPMDEDPLFVAAEDNEWAYRVLRAGFPIVYEPESVVVHMAWRDGSALDQVAWRYARGQGAFYGKYLRRADLHLARRAGGDLLRGLWWWLRGEVGGDRALAERGRAGSVGLMEGLVAGVVRGGPLVGPAGRRAPRPTRDGDGKGESEGKRG